MAAVKNNIPGAFPTMDYTGRLCPKGAPFFRMEVYKWRYTSVGFHGQRARESGVVSSIPARGIFDSSLNRLGGKS